jgi:murein DD-endopeptidase MepM/ murein hydrolase activator NlpD
VGLVAMTAALGISAATGNSSAAPALQTALSFDLVGHARGAAASQHAQRSARFELVPQVGSRHLLAERGAPATLPGATPLPTPIPPPAPSPEVQPVAATLPVATQPPSVASTGQLAWPVPGGVISQYFSSYHPALDIAAPYGSAVVAADDGVVTFAGWRTNGGGLVVAVDHGNGIQTVYNHLGSINVGLGQAVARGQLIAQVGCTGICTGPHVHFEVLVGGVFTNPLRYL